MTNATLINLVKTQYNEAIANAIQTAKTYGVCSKEMYDAITVRLEAEEIVTLYGFERECGIKYTNVFD